jgi:hypothetical protein
MIFDSETIIVGLFSDHGVLFDRSVEIAKHDPA